MRSEGKMKGVILALNSSVEEQLPAKSVVKGCKDPFSKNHVGLRPLDWALQSWGDCSGWRIKMCSVLKKCTRNNNYSYFTILKKKIKNK